MSLSKVIVITGSVGTGKTTLAKKLAKLLKARHIEISKFVKEKKIYSYYDSKRKTYVVDVKKLNSMLLKEIKNSKEKIVIVDGHLAHYLPKRYVSLCIVCKVPLKVIKERLQKRKYSKQKIRENLDAEIFDVCLIEAQERGHKILTIDTSKKYKLKELLKEIRGYLS